MISHIPTESYHRKRPVDFMDIPEYGLSIPARYGNTDQEYTDLQTRSVVLDRSHHGRLRLTGKDVLDLLQRLGTNHVLGLLPGSANDTVLTNEKGRIIDRVSIANVGEYFLLTTSPQNQDRVMAWLDRYIIMDDVNLEDVTSKTVQLTVAGPSASSDAGHLIQADAYIGLDFDQVTTYSSILLGQQSVDFVAPVASCDRLFGLMSNFRPCGYDAWIRSEVENLLPASPWELNDQYNPLEAGLSHLVDFTKGCYIGQEVIARLDAQQKVQKRLCLFSMRDYEMRGGNKLFFNDKESGFITRVAPSITGKTPIAIGFVKYEFIEIGRLFTVGNPMSQHTTELISVSS